MNAQVRQVLKLAFFVPLVAMLARPAPAQISAEEPVEPDWIGANEQQGAEYGFAVGAAGDVNGDGYGDVIVGAPRHDSVTYRAGSIFVYYGSQRGLSPEPDWITGCEQTGARFGAAVSGAGDFNGDGHADIIVGAPRYNLDIPEAGRALVFHGSVYGLSATPDWTWDGAQAGELLGTAVAMAGDINGDGFDDALVGVSRYDGQYERAGRALLFLGSATGLAASPNWSATGEATEAGFGLAVAPAGDVNGDGFDDVLVGAPNQDASQLDAGAAFLFYGSSAGLHQSPGWRFYGDQISERVGASLAGPGDINGDGYDDILIGAPGWGEDAGAVFVFPGSAAGPAGQPVRQISGSQPAAQFAASISSAGDVNQDGLADVVVGAPYFTDDQPLEGAAYLYYGALATLLHPGWRATGEKSETMFGLAVGGAGDVNRDGYSEIIVGAPTYRQGTIIVGRAFGFHGELFDVPVPAAFLPLLRANND